MNSKKYTVLQYTINLSESVVIILNNFIQKEFWMPESGGILLGQIRENNIYIQKITTPNKFDRASRFNFTRDKDAAQLVLDYEVINSQNTITYLGEWHTHPENIPTPSGQDKRMIKGQYDLGQLNLPFLFLIIQGLEETYVSIFIDNKLHKAELLDNYTDK